MKLKRRRENTTGYAFLAPWLIGFAVFTVFPLLYTVFLSFHEVRLTVQGWRTTWVGFENYTAALLRGTAFTPGLLRFFVIEVVYVSVILITAFLLAVILNRRIPFRLGFRLIFFLPVIILSGSVMHQLMDAGSTRMAADLSSFVIFRVIGSYSGVLASALELLLENFIMILWFTGIPIVLFLNVLQKIDPSVIEAARIDGAAGWQILWKITIPAVRPVALTAAVFTIVQIGLFPINPVHDIIRDASFNTANGLGMASTLSWIYSIVVLVLVGIAFLVLREPQK